MEDRVERSQSVTSSFIGRLGFKSNNNLIAKKELPISILKLLTNKNFEKQKEGNNELQMFLRHQIESGNVNAIQNIIELFKQEFVNNSQDHYRNVGLFAYSAIATSPMSSQEIELVFPDLIEQALNCFGDQVPKVRYHAVEVLYNIAKACKEQVIQHLSVIMKCLTYLYSDRNNEVKSAAEKLDCLLKLYLVDTGADQEIFDSVEFLETIQEVINQTTHPDVQKFIISWLIILNSIPSFNLLDYLNYFFEGLFLMLESSKIEVQHAAYWLLRELLENIKERIESDKMNFVYVIETLIKLINRHNTYVKSEVTTWINELVNTANFMISSQFPNILKVVLLTLSDSEKYIVELSEATNKKLLELSLGFENMHWDKFDFSSLVAILVPFLKNSSKKTSMAVLDWILTLEHLNPKSLESTLLIILNTLTYRLVDPDYSIVSQIICVFGKIAGYPGYFEKVIESVLNLFKEAPLLLENSGFFIIKHLCLHLGTEKVYQCFAETLRIDKEREFSKKLIETLTDLLLIEPSFESQRDRLRYCLCNQDTSCIEFVESLFKAWSINPGSTLILLYLIQGYELAYDLFGILSKCRVTLSLLTQLAKLVKVLDSPLFVHLRIQMLEYQKYPFLLKSLYALLMFLPQSDAHETLRKRLKQVSALHNCIIVFATENSTKTHLLKHIELKNYFSQLNPTPLSISQQS
ncbi:unnamed protein product [Blepharisma stoltei]|uniref:Vacuolar protein 14 C-terminal Fig4-binding domain-containing protein n=1 Tax=Blepharisma stoltei TaxID=1481888 RepID=A0AAU9K0S0_9CILI|nr:unnamed protein product [Blepharisma stoltei]